MRILFLHTFYRDRGGEDFVCENEIGLLREMGHEVHSLFFHNASNTWFKFLLLPFNFYSYRKTKKKIAAIDPDIIHIHNFHFAGSPALIRAAKKMLVPCVITLHNFR